MEAAALEVINRRHKQEYIPGYKLLGQKGRVMKKKGGKCDGNQGFKGGCKGEGRTRDSVK